MFKIFVTYKYQRFIIDFGSEPKVRSANIYSTNFQIHELYYDTGVDKDPEQLIFQ